MSHLILKVIAMVALPAAVFLGGTSLMAKISNRHYLTQQLQQAPDPKDRKPLNVRWGYDIGAVNRQWRVLDETARAAEQRFLKLDLFFPFFYGAALAASLLMAPAMLNRRFSPTWLLSPVVVMMLADWTENLVLMGQLRRFTERGETALQPSWIRVASLATSLKLLSFYAVCLLLVTLIMLLFFQPFKKRGSILTE